MLLKHYQTHPELQIRDVFKFLYQSAFGCGHFVSSPRQAAEGIASEYSGAGHGDAAVVEPLDGPYGRVPLSYMEHGLSAQTFGKLFAASAKQETDGPVRLAHMLCAARELVCDGELPFSQKAFDDALAAWKEENYPPLHHSDRYRESYHPAYRVVADRYIPFLPLFAQLDRRLEQGSVLLAVDGGSASGKTTLGGLLGELYDCTVFHMDDFFLRPEQRTPERFAEIGGNVDWERFLEEVLQPLSRGEDVVYRKFDCAAMSLGEELRVSPKRLVVVEGAYSMHTKLAEFYDVSVFLDASPELQRERILRRNTPEMAQRFFDRWIPLERAYFTAAQVKERCHMTIRADGTDHG